MFPFDDVIMSGVFQLHYIYIYKQVPNLLYKRIIAMNL